MLSALRAEGGQPWDSPGRQGTKTGSTARSAPQAHYSLFHLQLKWSPNVSFCAAWQYHMCFRTIIMTNSCKNPPKLHLTQTGMFYFIMAVESQRGVNFVITRARGEWKWLGNISGLTWFQLLIKHTNCSLKCKQTALRNVSSLHNEHLHTWMFFPMKWKRDTFEAKNPLSWNGFDPTNNTKWIYFPKYSSLADLVFFQASSLTDPTEVTKSHCILGQKMIC